MMLCPTLGSVGRSRGPVEWWWCTIHSDQDGRRSVKALPACVPPTILNYLPKFTSCTHFEIGVLAKYKSGGPFLSVDQIGVGLENWENDKTLV